MVVSAQKAQVSSGEEEVEREADGSIQVSPETDAKAAMEEAEECAEEDLEEELICFDRKSAWSIPLVLSMNSFAESVFVCALLIVNVAMQSLFTFIIASFWFLGEGFSANLQTARVWRSSFAHDVQFVDLAGRSLATRVCDEDGSLLYSATQVTLVSSINSYLGPEKLGERGFAVTSFQPGALLAVLCILLWIICVTGELRQVWYVLQAVLFGDRQTNPAKRVRPGVPALSGRRAAAMAFVCLGRAAVACALLVSGTLWLSRTTSITELMLNSVALEAVLHVDEFIFSAFVPTHFQQQIQRLPPVMMRKSSRWPRVENLVLACILLTGLLLPYFLLLLPLTDDMLAVKKQLCGGTLTFALGSNDKIVGFANTTGPDEDGVRGGIEGSQTYAQAMAMQYAFPTSEGERVVPYPTPALSVLRKWMSEDYYRYKTRYDACYRHGLGGDFSLFIAAASS